MKYEITGYRENDEYAIAELYKKAFDGRILDIDMWRMVHKTNPAKGYCMASMWDGNRLIAHTELFTAKAYLNHKLILSGTSGDTMADNAYPGAGVAVYRWIDQKYDDIFKIGFPNENSFPVVTRVLKHNHIGDIDFWWKAEKSLDDMPENRNSFLTQEMSQPSEAFDFDEFCKSFRYSLLRDRDFIIWRFINRKAKQYHYFECTKNNHIVGYMVCNIFIVETEGRQERHGQIDDIAALSKDAFVALIRHAEAFFKKEHVCILKLWCTKPEFIECLELLGYSYGLRPFHVELWNQKLKLEEAYLTMADSDIF